MANHLHQLAQALRAAADANDMDQVKRYIGQINSFADNLDVQDKAKREAEERTRQAAEKADQHDPETVKDEAPQPRPTAQKK